MHRLIRKLNNVIFFLILLGCTAVFLLPLYMAVTSVGIRDFLNLAISNIDIPMLFPRYFINTVLLTVLTVMLGLRLTCPAGYALAKLRFPGCGFLNRTVELGLLLSGSMLFVTQYIVLNKTHLINTFPALVLPLISMPLGVVLIREYTRQISDDIIDAARLDGASHRRICADIIYPNIKPARVTLVIILVINAWQAESYNFVYSESLRLLGDLKLRLGEAGYVAALSLIVMIIPMAAFAVYRRSIRETLAVSGVEQSGH